MTIANGVVTALRDARILLPSISTIERASIAGRARARKQAAYALIADLSVEQVHTLDRLFDDADGMSQLASLKTIPIAAKPDHIRQILDRLRQVRKIGISPDVAGRIHADRFRQYVREGRASPAYMIERSEEPTSELQSLMRISDAVFCLKKKKKIHTKTEQLILN